jgi:hypothetical protein
MGGLGEGYGCRKELLDPDSLNGLQGLWDEVQDRGG